MQSMQLAGDAMWARFCSVSINFGRCWAKARQSCLTYCPNSQHRAGLVDIGWPVLWHRASYRRVLLVRCEHVFEDSLAL